MASRTTTTVADSSPLLAATEAFQRGQAALRNDEISLAVSELARAVDLNPQQFDYQASLAWARFCAADDKARIADTVRRTLHHAMQKSGNPEFARFYLARMERMLGRDREALRHFQQVLEVEPRNAEAASEVRLIENRLAAGSGSGGKLGLGGLFNRKKTR